MLGKANE